jgi:hypothetical protein
MWNQPLQQRLTTWRTFRDTLGNKTLHDAIHATNNFWNKLPIDSSYYRYDHLELWPGPWELLQENYYDNIAKSLGMLYTIVLSKHGDNIEIDIRHYQSQTSIHDVVWIDQGKYVLNWDLEVRVNTSLQLENYSLVGQTTATDLLGAERNERYSSNKTDRRQGAFRP